VHWGFRSAEASWTSMVDCVSPISPLRNDDFSFRKDPKAIDLDIGMSRTESSSSEISQQFTKLFSDLTSHCNNGEDTAKPTSHDFDRAPSTEPGRWVLGRQYPIIEDKFYFMSIRAFSPDTRGQSHG